MGVLTRNSVNEMVEVGLMVLGSVRVEPGLGSLRQLCWLPFADGTGTQIHRQLRQLQR